MEDERFAQGLPLSGEVGISSIDPDATAGIQQVFDYVNKPTEQESPSVSIKQTKSICWAYVSVLQIFR